MVKVIFPKVTKTENTLQSVFTLVATGVRIVQASNKWGGWRHEKFLQKKGYLFMCDLKHQRNLCMMYHKLGVTLECGRTLNINELLCSVQKRCGIYEEKNRILFSSLIIVTLIRICVELSWVWWNNNDLNTSEKRGQWNYGILTSKTPEKWLGKFDIWKVSSVRRKKQNLKKTSLGSTCLLDDSYCGLSQVCFFSGSSSQRAHSAHLQCLQSWKCLIPVFYPFHCFHLRFNLFLQLVMLCWSQLSGERNTIRW